VDPALLILDLDETLLFGTETPLPRTPDFRVGPFSVYLRPHVHEFIGTVAQWYKLAVWTSASHSYAEPVVSRLFPPPIQLEFLWSHLKCIRRFNPEDYSYYSVKDLNKVKRRGFPLERILMIDDSPEKLERHYGNHLRVRPFLGGQTDTELRDLLPYLESLRHVENFRRMEKRNWRDRIT
jgi:TFIIF-interacting CTD phosphatase-like protein